SLYNLYENNRNDFDMHLFVPNDGPEFDLPDEECFDGGPCGP
ncbi:10927_t:CDS:1, partial [Rhizophagus irregularis]